MLYVYWILSQKDSPSDPNLFLKRGIIIMGNTELNGKTKVELLAIAAGRGITGLENQTAALIIQVIENDMVDKNQMPSRDQLNGMSVDQLLELADENGMTGLGKQPKAILVELLVAKFTKAVLASVAGTFTVEKTGECVVVKFIVTCGTNDTTLEDVIGRKVGEIRVFLKTPLNIADGAKALINGTKSVNDDYVITATDLTLEFTKPADRKG